MIPWESLLTLLGTKQQLLLLLDTLWQQFPINTKVKKGREEKNCTNTHCKADITLSGNGSFMREERIFWVQQHNNSVVKIIQKILFWIKLKDKLFYNDL